MFDVDSDDDSVFLITFPFGLRISEINITNWFISDISQSRRKPDMVVRYKLRFSSNEYEFFLQIARQKCK